MKDSVLSALATRWEQDATPPSTSNGNPSSEQSLLAAVAKARRETFRECADALRMLVNLLGDKGEVP